MSKNDQFVPFGKEWKDEVMKMTVRQLEQSFTLKKNDHESKSDFVDRIIVNKKRMYS